MESSSTRHRFEAYLGLAGDAQAAAMLTLADAITACVAAPPPSPDADALLTLPEVARRLNVSQDTVRDLIESGKLISSRIGKGRGTHRVSPADLEQYRLAAAGNPLPHRRITRSVR